MKVSIVTVVYNNRAFIADCLQSVINQTYPNIEHIVIDGGSTDGTQQQIEPLRGYLAYYISEKDRGLYDALNKGIAKATGDIVGILHSDDMLFETTTIEKVVARFKQTGADLVYANGMYVERENIQKVNRIYSSRPFDVKHLFFGWIPLHTTIFVKNSIYQQYGLYHCCYRVASDYEISLRWFKNDAIKKDFNNLWVVKMRMGGKSTSANLQRLKSREDLQIIRKHGLWGPVTLTCKIVRKIPQYVLPKFIDYNKKVNN